MSKTIIVSESVDVEFVEDGYIVNKLLKRTAFEHQHRIFRCFLRLLSRLINSG